MVLVYTLQKNYNQLKLYSKQRQNRDIRDKLTLGLYSRLFQKAGFLAITAADGKEGLRIITEEKPIAAVIDYNLPSLSGIEICEQVRSQEEHSDMKLVLFTMDDRQETRTRALQAGANEVVVKSSDASELVDTVIKLLRDGKK